MIACAADRRYALPLAVMLRAVADNLGPGLCIEAHVVDDGIEDDDKRRVESSLPEQVALRWTRPSRVELAGLPIWGRMSPTTYRKLTLADWLPSSVSKAIWLDCDALALSDVGALWRMELAGRHALAAQDTLVPRISSRFGVAAYRELGIDEDAKYFNAGVLVNDVAAWRRDEVARRALDYLRRYGERVFFWDQEALNAVLAGRWSELDPRWNWNPTAETMAARDSAGARGVPADPWIVHFSGNLKPWTYAGSGAYHRLYYSYLDRTAWAGWRPARSMRGIALAAYESSRLRRLMYPVEQLGTRLLRALTRRHLRGNED